MKRTGSPERQKMGNDVSVGTQCDQRNQVGQITWKGPGIAESARFTHNPLGDLVNIKRYADTTGTNLIGQTTYSYARNLPNIGYQAAAFNATGNQTQTVSFAQSEAFGPLQNDAATSGLSAHGTQPLARLGSITYQDGNGDTLLSEAYANDQAGQLTRKNAGNDNTTFSYDQTSQLTGATHSTNTSLNENYTYDGGGNRIEAGTQSGMISISTSDCPISDANYTYSHDDEGNLITKTETATGKVWTYSYDLRNRMVGAVQKQGVIGPVLTQASYFYDVFDRRIAKTVNGQHTAFYYEGDNLCEQVGSSGAVRYLTGGAIDQWLGRSNANGVASYVTDRLGSVIGITDNAGALLNTTKYDSYGHIQSQTNPSLADPLESTGREYDAETGLYYFRAR